MLLAHKRVGYLHIGKSWQHYRNEFAFGFWPRKRVALGEYRFRVNFSLAWDWLWDPIQAKPWCWFTFIKD